jgi:GxxExxY protein
MNTNKNSNQMNTSIVLPELSYKIMGALISVHNELGPSLLEKYYQQAVAKEFDLLNIKYKKEVPITLQYKDISIGKYFLDFIVEEQIILETKAQAAYNPKFFKQALAYLNETHLPLAILVNFHSPRLEYKRIINNSSIIRE